MPRVAEWGAPPDVRYEEEGRVPVEDQVADGKLWGGGPEGVVEGRAAEVVAGAEGDVSLWGWGGIVCVGVECLCVC